MRSTMTALLKPNIEKFIEECSLRVANKKLKLIPRTKNIDSMYEMGLSIYNIEEMINALTIENYHDGPLEDHKLPEDEVWVFIVLYEGYRIYMKLKLEKEEDVICISFHEAEY